MSTPPLLFNYYLWIVELAALMGFKRCIDRRAFLANNRGASWTQMASDAGFALRKTREKRHVAGFTTNEQAQLRGCVAHRIVGLFIRRVRMLRPGVLVRRLKIQ